MTEEQLMGTEDVARYLNVHFKTVMHLVESGELPAYKVGRVWRYRKSDVDAWLEARKHVPGQEQSKKKIVEAVAL